MKDLRRVIKEFALEAMSNDYEDLATVLGEVSRWAHELGTAVTREEVIAAVEELVREGHAQSYVFSLGPNSKAEPVEFSLNGVDDLWFYVTPKGKSLVRQLQAEADAEDERRM